MIGSQWARLRSDASVPLRRGAWYRVLRVTASDAILDVHQRVVNVPRAALQMTPRAPGVWAIVARPGNARHLPQSWGPRYAVCPKCHGRAPLPKGPLNMRCGSCGGVFDVGWGDAYDA
jgi:hypothetical protein